jgi:hypothetical protein
MGIHNNLIVFSLLNLLFKIYCRIFVHTFAEACFDLQLNNLFCVLFFWLSNVYRTVHRL